MVEWEVIRGDVPIEYDGLFADDLGELYDL